MSDYHSGSFETIYGNLLSQTIKEYFGSEEINGFDMLFEKNESLANNIKNLESKTYEKIVDLVYKSFPENHAENNPAKNNLISLLNSSENKIKERFKNSSKFEIDEIKYNSKNILSNLLYILSETLFSSLETYNQHNGIKVRKEDSSINIPKPFK